MAVLTKPQAVLIVPVVMLAGLLSTGWRSNFTAWAVGGLTAVAICFPWIVTGRVLGIPLAMIHVAQYPNLLTVESLNSWWVFNYALGVRDAIASGGPFWSTLLGFGPTTTVMRSHAELAEWLGVNLTPLALLAFAGATAAILWSWARAFRARPPAMVAFVAGMVVFAYFLFGKAIHTNHYFLMIPLFALYVAVEPRLRIWFGVMVGSFLFQDILFYGFGRDLTMLQWELRAMGLFWTTNLVSGLNLALFFYGLRHLWENTRAGGTADSPNEVSGAGNIVIK